MKSICMRTMLFMVSFCLVGTVYAAGGVVKSPTGTAPDCYVYYPGTEAQAPMVNAFKKENNLK